MAKSLQVTVTNPDDLNTLQGELVTQNYNLEILGLKNPADFRKFSKSLMMLDRILKETNDKVDNGLKTKVDKAGDTMTGPLNLKNGLKISGNLDGYNYLALYDNDNQKGILTYISNMLTLRNQTSGNAIRLSDNGSTEIDANNLETIAKEIVAAINELNDGKEPAFSKKSGFNLDKTDEYTEDDTNKVGTARALKMLYDWTRNKFTLSWERITNKPNLMTSENVQTLLKTKVDKAGDTMTGPLNLKNGLKISGNLDGYNYLALYDNDNQKGVLTYASNMLTLRNQTNGNAIRLLDNGSTEINATNLETINKEIVASINEVYKLQKNGIGTQTIEYIQTAGTKYRNKIYLDQITNEVYICYPRDLTINSVTDTTVTTNFIKLSLALLGKRYLIERAEASNSRWYEKYSDGTLIQGMDYVSFNGYGMEHEFILGFKDTNYNAQCSARNNDKDTFIRFYNIKPGSIGVASNGKSGTCSIICHGRWA